MIGNFFKSRFDTINIVDEQQVRKRMHVLPMDNNKNA